MHIEKLIKKFAYSKGAPFNCLTVYLVIRPDIWLSSLISSYPARYLLIRPDIWLSGQISGYPAKYLVIRPDIWLSVQISGYPARYMVIRKMKPDIRPDKGYKKGRISGTTLETVRTTKRGGGVRARPLRKKKLSINYYYTVCFIEVPRFKGNVVVVVYVCSISNVMYTGDIEALLKVVLCKLKLKQPSKTIYFKHWVCVLDLRKYSFSSIIMKNLNLLNKNFNIFNFHIFGIKCS